SSTIRVTPRTCPSARASRLSRSAFDALYPGVFVLAMLPSIPPWGIVVKDGGRDLHDRRGLQAVLPDGLRGLVGSRAGLRHLRDRPGLGAAPEDPIGPRWRRLRTARQGDGPRRCLVLVLVRRDRDRQVALPEGGLGGHRPSLPVRLDQPRLGARPRDLDSARLAVHPGGVR